jgi:hypothetical protein
MDLDELNKRNDRILFRFLILAGAAIALGLLFYR